MKITIIFLLFIFFIRLTFIKNINIVLTYPNVNFTKLPLILNETLKLSKCPTNNYSINFVKFNETSTYQSPISQNNFQGIDLIFGPNRFFGPSFYGFTSSSTSFKFQSTFIPNYYLDLSGRFLIMLSVLNKVVANDNVKVVIFILNGSSVNLMEPWKTFNPHQYLSSFQGSIAILYYNNASDALRIATEIKSRGVFNIVMDLNFNASITVLNACNSRNLLNLRQRWMIFFSLIPFNNNALKIVLPSSSNFTMYDFVRLTEFSSNFIETEHDIFLYDVCYTVVKLMDFQNCNQPIPSILNLGTGTAIFDGQTIQRTTWYLQAFQSTGLVIPVGNITVTQNNNVTLNQPQVSNLINRTISQILSEMRSKIFRIAAMIEKPFVYYDESGNLTGYSVETINSIMNNLNITMQITTYNLSTGTLNNGQFSGILGILQNGQADIAIGPITYNPTYTNYINFTTQLKSYQLTILYKIPSRNQYEEMFEFIFVFKYPVWIIFVASSFVYACALTIVNLISPNVAKMTLYDTFFFTMGSMVQGVTTALPDKLSGRILVIFWWILNISVLLTYVANYGAFRTSVRLQSTITDYTDLLQQTKYTFGTVINSSVDEYFASAQSQGLQRINTLMRTGYLPFMANSTDVALNQVQNQSYAFIYQDAVLNQYTAIKCNTITQSFELFFYAFALVDSEYTTVINSALNDLIAQNILVGLNNKYFPTIIQPDCVSTDWLGNIFNNISYEFIPNPLNSLNMRETAGIFVIMLIGIIISIIVALIEFIVKKFKKKKVNNSESDA